MKTAGELVCDNRELFHPDAKPQAMIDLVRMIQADALRHAASLVVPDGNPELAIRRINFEAVGIEKGSSTP